MRRLICAACVLAFAVAPASAGAQRPYPELARTPPMGWNDWYSFFCNIDEQLIKQTADAMVASGMRDAGYEYVNLDDCWMARERDAQGRLQADPERFPSGIEALADYVHARGLKLGIYEDVGTRTCAGFPGSYGHFEQDARTFAEWGVDFVKMDWCNVPFEDFPGLSQQEVAKRLYGDFADAIRAAGRPMVFSICVWNPAVEPWEFAPAISHMSRTNGDYGPSWSQILANLDHEAELWSFAGNGHWNDPDIMMVGIEGLSVAESRSHFSLWSLLAAPLLAGNDLRTMSPATRDILTNREVIAVDQDPLGLQGRRLWRDGDRDVWVKPLAGGDRAVVLLNRGERALAIRTTAGELGLRRAARYELRDLWAHESRESARTISATVAPHDVAMFRVSPTGDRELPPATTLAVDSTELTVPGRPTTVTVSLTNHGRRPIRDAGVRLDAPAGWTVRALTGSSRPALGTDRPLAARFEVSPPSGLLPMSYPLTAGAEYRADGRRETKQTEAPLNVPPAPPGGAVALSDHPWLDASSGWEYATIDASVAGGGPITIAGRRYDKGIGVASPSEVDFYLGGNCTRLQAAAGIDDIVDRISPEGGTATFAVHGDDRTLFESGVVGRGTVRDIDVDLSGVQVLSLRVGDAGDGGYNDRADWADLRATCGPVPGDPWPRFVPRGELAAAATSAHAGYQAANAIDGDRTSIWHSEWAPPAPLPQSITLDLGRERALAGLTYQPRLDGSRNGTITGYRVLTSRDGDSFAEVARGSWSSDRTLKAAAFDARARYVRLEATAAVGGFASAAELGVAEADRTTTTGGESR